MKNDYYWHISQEEIYNSSQDLTDLTLGQLSDDLTEIKRVLIDDCIIPYDLQKVSEILKALSIENEIAF